MMRTGSTLPAGAISGSCTSCSSRLKGRHHSVTRHNRSGEASLRPAEVGHAGRRQHEHLQCAAGLFSGFQKSASPDQGNAEPQQKPATAKVEMPGFQIVQKTENYTLRLYETYHFAWCPYTRRDEGWLALGGYMDGENTEGAKFCETQPVFMSYNPDGSKHMLLYVGSRRDQAAADQKEHSALQQVPPAPTQPDVGLDVGGGEVVAVAQFGGSATKESTELARRRLAAALQADGIELGLQEQAGKFRLAQYGPLNSLKPRVNEIMLKVRV